MLYRAGRTTGSSRTAATRKPARASSTSTASRSASTRAPSGRRSSTRPGGSTATTSTPRTCTGPTGRRCRRSTRASCPHAADRGDLYRVIRWMLQRAGASATASPAPGERLDEPKTVPGGLLGADYEVANGRYRFKKVYGGLNWTPDAPLAADRARRGRQGRRVPAGRATARTSSRRRDVYAPVREHGRQDASRSRSARTPTAPARAP